MESKAAVGDTSARKATAKSVAERVYLSTDNAAVKHGEPITLKHQSAVSGFVFRRNADQLIRRSADKPVHMSVLPQPRVHVSGLNLELVQFIVVYKIIERWDI